MLILMKSGGTYTLTSTLDDMFWLVMANLFTLSFFALRLMRGKAPEKNTFFIIRFVPDVRVPTHLLLGLG